MMERKRFEFLLRAASPVAHHSETFGNQALLMRQRVRQEDGSFAAVPIITGDTMRHGLREAGTYALLDCAGLLGETLTEAALRLLFAGGMVTGTGSTVRLDQYRDLVDLIPTLALLGGCAQNRVIPGRMTVDCAYLVCQETEHLLPEWVTEWVDGQVVSSCREHVELVQRVRMDPTLDPGKRALLAEGESAKVEQRMLLSESASATDDAKAKDASKSSMMPRSFETVSQGSIFWWSLSATCYSELDVDSLMVMMGAFLADCQVGGKRGTGHGRLIPVAARNVDLARYRDAVSTFDLSKEKVGEIFRAHVQERAEQIREFLAEVSA